MKILAKISAILIVLILYPLSFSQSGIFAQESEEPELTLYVSDTCEHCETLLEELEEKELTQFVVIKEVSGDENLAEFRNTVDKCGVRSAVPLLYDGELCTQGSFGIKEIVYPVGGLEVEDPTPSYEERQVLSGEEDPDILEEETIVSNSEEEISNADSLAQVLGSSMDGNSSEPIHLSVPTIIIMFIAPAIFLTIAYLLLTKMKV